MEGIVVIRNMHGGTGCSLRPFLRSVRFLMTVEFGNVTRASEVMEMSQPSLSRILNNLERELGATLLIRSPAVFVSPTLASDLKSVPKL
jgi:hypothetical protein